MKKLIILAMVLALMVMATTVLAHPSENSPWVGGQGMCDHRSGAPGELYLNTNTGNTNCFKAH